MRRIEFTNWHKRRAIVVRENFLLIIVTSFNVYRKNRVGRCSLRSEKEKPNGYDSVFLFEFSFPSSSLELGETGNSDDFACIFWGSRAPPRDLFQVPCSKRSLFSTVGRDHYSGESSYLISDPTCLTQIGQTERQGPSLINCEDELNETLITRIKYKKLRSVYPVASILFLSLVFFYYFLPNIYVYISYIYIYMYFHRIQ